jgi:cytochrome c oxidase subunit 2
MQKETSNPDFVYEIACDQMCGAGHTGMRGEILVETQQEFDQWMKNKKPKWAAIKKEMLTNSRDQALVTTSSASKGTN